MAILPHVGNGANIRLELATPVSPRRGKPAENLEMPFHVSLPWDLIQIQLQ